MNREEQKFCERWEATVRQGTTRYSRREEITFENMYDDVSEIKMWVEPSVEITMPRDRYKALLEKEAYLAKVLDPQTMEHYHPADILLDDYTRECKMRHQYPAVMKAYEKYKNLLDLVSSHYD